MTTKNIKQWAIFPCSPKTAYNAWLDSKTHGKMIKGSVKIDPKVGGNFSIWDESMTGKTLELHPEKYRIVQSWRYSYDDWPEDKMSKIIIEFVPYKNNQCKMRFWQSGIPEKYADDIATGWKEYYWEPMKQYFSGLK